MIRAALIVAALLCSLGAAAELPEEDANGWFQWMIDNEDQTIISVRLKDGELTGLRTHSFVINCSPGPVKNAVDLGNVSPAENFEWFRALVENADHDRDSRETALFGLVQSGTEEAFQYVESLLGLG